MSAQNDPNNAAGDRESGAKPKPEETVLNEFEDTTPDVLSGAGLPFPLSSRGDAPGAAAAGEGEPPRVSSPAAENAGAAQEGDSEDSPADKEEPADNMEAELEEFDSLIGAYLEGIVQHEVSSVISVKVVEVHSDNVLVDLGDKAEGVIDIQEFFNSRGYISISVGDMVDVEILGRDEETGLIEVSHKAARIHGAWRRLEESHANGTPIRGNVTRTVKSGLLVDVGIEVFMPASQISDRRVADLEEWVGKDVDALVLDLNQQKNRAVVSRRKLIEASKQKALGEALDKLQEGDVVQGKVRNIQSFGAFLDLGGVDGYLPREELSWDRGVIPASVLTQDSTLKVKILQIEKETGRVKISRKALRQDPWETVGKKYHVDSQVRGEVVSVTHFGAFVRIEEGLTGLIHISELSWNREPQRVTDHVKEGDTVRAVVLAVDTEKRRLSLGLKQLVEDPWIEAEKLCPVGSNVKGVVTNLATFGAFVRLADNIEGLIHISDFSWEEKIKHPGEVLKVGQEVEARVLKTDRNTHRISLGLKQLTESPVDRFLKKHRAGSVVEGEVVRMIPVGAFVSLVPPGPGGKLDGFLHVSQINTERVEKPEDALKKGEKIECKIVKIDKRSGKISLSRKALLEQQEREAIKEFGSGSRRDKGVMKLGDLMRDINFEALVKKDAPGDEKEAPAAASEPEAKAQSEPQPEPQPEEPPPETAVEEKEVEEKEAEEKPVEEKAPPEPQPEEPPPETAVEEKELEEKPAEEKPEAENSEPEKTEGEKVEAEAEEPEKKEPETSEPEPPEPELSKSEPPEPETGPSEETPPRET